MNRSFPVLNTPPLLMVVWFHRTAIQFGHDTIISFALPVPGITGFACKRGVSAADVDALSLELPAEILGIKQRANCNNWNNAPDLSAFLAYWCGWLLVSFVNAVPAIVDWESQVDCVTPQLLPFFAAGGLSLIPKHAVRIAMAVAVCYCGH
jgi:hypothetical protein